MALKERRIPYETLIRWHEDGRIGAHQVYLDQILKDGVVISSAQADPVQLSTADFDGELSLSNVLGEATKSALVQVEGLNQALDASNQTIGVLQQRTAELGDQLSVRDENLASYKNQIDLANLTISDLESQLVDQSDLQRQVQELDELAASLRGELEALRNPPTIEDTAGDL